MQTLNVSGMGCSSCVSKITKAIQQLDAAAQVRVDLSHGRVEVASQVSVVDICRVITELGYQAFPA